MAVLLYRRLHRVGFQAAISASKWTCIKLPDQHVRSCVSDKASACSKEANPKKLGHKESFACHTAYTGIEQITSHAEGKEPKGVCSIDNDYPIDFKSNLDHQTPPSTSVRKSMNRKDIEAFDTTLDLRAFQQLRPEYKSMCYNSERLTKISIETNGIMQKPTDTPKPGEVSEFSEKLLPVKRLEKVKSDTKFTSLFGTTNLRLYTNSDLISRLGDFARLGIPRSHPMLRVYEQEFCFRLPQLSTDELLLVADTFRYIGCRVPTLLQAMYNCMQLRCVDLTLPQVVQLVYIMGEGRHVPEEFVRRMDTMVFKYREDVNLEEIGTVCLGFFKTGNGLPKQVMLKFAEIVETNIQSMSNLSLVNLLKMIRFTRVDHLPLFRRVGQDAAKRLPGMGMQSIMHVVLTFSSMHILDKDLMDAVAVAVPGGVSYCRSKDLAKFLWSFGTLHFTPLNADVFYSAFINQIRNKLEEFEKFPEHFLTCLLGLAFCQQFPFDLINIALSDKFTMYSSKISNFDLQKDLFTLAGAVEIECPQYTGNTVSPKFRKDITDMLVERSTQGIYTRNEVITARILMKQVLGGPQYVKEHMILPHIRSKDLEIHLDANRKPIAINSVTVEHERPFVNNNIRITDDLLNRLTNSSAQTAAGLNSEIGNPGSLNVVGDLPMTICPEEKSEKCTGQSEVIKLAIQVTNRNNYLYGSKELLGLHAMKRRHLNKLGYVVVEVPFWEWFPLARYGLRCEQLQYLHKKVFGAVQVN